MIKINLLPVKAAKKKQKLWNELAVAIVVLVIVIAMLAYLYYSKANEVDIKRDQVAKLEQDLRALKSTEENLKRLQEEEKRVENQLKAITKLQTGRDWFIRILDKITESVPPKTVWLRSIDFGKGRGKSQKIVIKGSAYDKDSVAVFMGNLAIIPCDDDKEDHQKAKICQERNERCLKTLVAGQGDEDLDKYGKYKHADCKDFYLQIDDQIKEAKKALDDCAEDCAMERCKNNTDPNCKAGKLAACKDSQDCSENRDKLKDLQADHKKLHEEEYVEYDSIELKFIKATKSQGKFGSEVYEFEIQVKPTQPRD